MTALSRIWPQGSGPKQLREELHHRTGALRELLRKILAIKSVGKGIPQNLVGGELVALFSEQLQQVLSEDLESANRLSTNASQKLEAISQQNGKGPTHEIGDLLAPRTGDPTKKWPGLGSTGRHEQPTGNVFPRKGKSSESSAKRNLAAALARAVSEMSKPMGTNASRVQRGVAETDWTNRVKSRSADRRNKSMLLKKLDEYWQMSNQSTPAENKEKAEGHRLADKEKQLPFPDSWQRDLVNDRSWSDRTGMNVAQKLHQFTNDMGSSRRNSELQNPTQFPTVSKEQPIHNVFNIHVRGEEKNGEGNLSELSEHIADILREQAIQHGIDIT